MRCKVIGLAVVASILAGSFAGSPARAEQAVRPSGTAFEMQVVPRLDGKVLEDLAWQGAPGFSGFTQVRPYDGEPATQRTRVFVGFTADSLYIGVVCYDTNPEEIIVASSRRDSDLDDTDSFQVIIDSFQDGQNGFVFGTNPAGIEYDGQVTKEGSGSFGSGGSSFNLNWDTSWEVRARISDTGWSAELAIPFQSLRYGSGEIQNWGINFQRNIRRNNETVYWAPLGRQRNLYRVSEAGTVSGLKVPPQRNLQFTPYVVGLASRGGETSGTDYEGALGFDLKYSITPSLTLDATYNTDFAQVESDAFQINLDRFSLFFPEQRPFFLENAGQFAVGSPRELEMFFSRRIGIGSDGERIPILGGVRVSGKLGAATNVGFLQIRSESVNGVAPENDFIVARVNQELGNRSSLGAIFVNRQGAGGGDYNRTYALDGRWGIGDDLTLSSFVAKTDTPGISGKDYAFNLQGNYSSEKWSSNVGYTEVGDEFNPEVGFVSRLGYRKASAFLLRRIRPKNLWGLHELRPHIVYRGFWGFDGFHETGYLHVDNHWEWRSGLEIHTGVNLTREGVREAFEISEGVIVQPDTYDHSELALVYQTNKGAPLSLKVNAHVGGFFGGDRVAVSPTLNYRIGETFTSSLSWQHNSIDLPVPNGDFNVDLVQLRLSYSFTPKISLLGLVQYNKQQNLVATNLRFAWLQSANTGLYLVYNEVDEDGIGKPRREFILKYSRIFNLLR